MGMEITPLEDVRKGIRGIDFNFFNENPTTW